MPAVSASFIHGSVTPGSVLSANGRRVEVEPSGAFMAHIPFEEGDFTIRLEAANTKGKGTLERRVKVARARTLIPSAGLTIVPGTISPSRELSLLPGDRIYVSFRGTPRMKASFRIGQGTGVMMAEQGAPPERDERIEAFGEVEPPPMVLPGTYTGSCLVPEGAGWDGQRIYCCLIDSLGNETVDSTNPFISTWPRDPQSVARTTDTVTVLKTGPDLGYEMFLPPGIRLSLAGSDGDHYRVWLSQSKEAWVRKNSVELLPAGTVLAPAKAALAKVERGPRMSVVNVTLSRPAAYKVESSGDSRKLRLRLYHARADMDWVRYQAGDPFVTHIGWSQPESDVVALDIELSEPLWGYRAEYRGSVLSLSIRQKPRINRKSPFQNLRIAVDAGHSPDYGAVGPLRTLEKDVNWQTAQRLGKRLEGLGARVYYPRRGDEGVGIYQRPRRAVDWKADLLVSIHHNASPDGANPLKNSGFSTYFYHPHSREAARAVHLRFQKTLKLSDHGLFHGNLVLCRDPWMPSFLVEPAFLIVPRQEAMIRSAAFQEKVAGAIISGMRSFLLSEKVEDLAEEAEPDSAAGEQVEQ
jgi:N-acetylmuramoyl-L-alanine amidase